MPRKMKTRKISRKSMKRKTRRNSRKTKKSMRGGKYLYKSKAFPDMAK
jgi:hypothetical protein